MPVGSNISFTLRRVGASVFCFCRTTDEQGLEEHKMAAPTQLILMHLFPLKKWDLRSLQFITGRKVMGREEEYAYNGVNSM